MLVRWLMGIKEVDDLAIASRELRIKSGLEFMVENQKVNGEKFGRNMANSFRASW